MDEINKNEHSTLKIGTDKFLKSRSSLRPSSTNKSENVYLPIISAQSTSDAGRNNSSVERNHKRNKTYFYESSQDVSYAFF
jgi:hypothetical protein